MTAGRPPLSLTARLTLAASFALAAFLGITGLVLDRAFAENARDSVRDRLQGVIYTLLAAAELTEENQLFLPDASPEPRLSRPGSGLYAHVVGSNYDWQSGSMMGETFAWPGKLPIGETTFELPPDGEPESVFILSLGVAYESADVGDVPFVFSAAESAAAYQTQISEFRRALWGWLGAAAVLLLLVQGMVLGWSLRPLRAVSDELARVRRGEAQTLAGSYPEELAGLTDSINTFVSAERRQLARFRNALADLAHSLKTPLTVMRTAIDDERRPSPALLKSQLERMDDIVGYQLKRAQTSGHMTFARPVAIAGAAESVVQTLEQAYRDRQIRCEFELDDAARFYGEAGDLTELLGNLLENAFKWCQNQVLLKARSLPKVPGRRPGLMLAVEDDGPGFEADTAQRLLGRGVRGDEQVAGHGIGLAVVREIAEAYGARIELGRSALGGARVALTFGENDE